jgi:hypothetical protein
MIKGIKREYVWMNVFLTGTHDVLMGLKRVSS